MTLPQAPPASLAVSARVRSNIAAAWRAHWRRAAINPADDRPNSRKRGTARGGERGTYRSFESTAGKRGREHEARPREVPSSSASTCDKLRDCRRNERGGHQLRRAL